MVVDPNTKLYDSVTAERSKNDAPEPKFSVGQKVKLLSDISNDGTYPHAPVGATMIKKGAVGYIKEIGEFLQVVRVYEVHFFGAEDALVEIIGCRENELEALEPYKSEMQEERELLEAHRKRMQKK